MVMDMLQEKNYLVEISEICIAKDGKLFFNGPGCGCCSKEFAIENQGDIDGMVTNLENALKFIKENFILSEKK